ncbi:hypothetical protein HUG10_10220 [Halorarum halophilum]|uniref:Uncharacterized protein n=1 Tax=Halorarum halophilum TaxID=2743090 RepID=A0A7D5GC39_9EURY|nr:hypothetical protein [Halobaculum halophilum]QLG27905.1 hypothetical protein HUG10_10220 [Halobaculum halophilum]
MPQERCLERRRFLARVGAAGLAGTTGVRAAGRAAATGFAGSVESDDPFDPTVHAFGFRNWSTRSELFPDHAHDAVTRDEVRRTVERNWTGPLFALASGPTATSLPDSLVEAVSTQVYVSVNQLSATNGHCYGMCFAAQSYYERPDRIPLDRESASAFAGPTEPFDDGAEPVADEIDLYQTAQLLDVEAWLGRRALVRPSAIDYGRELEAVKHAVDADGTASVTLLAGTSRLYHQVLVYDYRRRGGGTDLLVYDPNYGARTYRTDAGREARRIRVSTADSPTTVSYDGYDGFVANRADRRIRLRTDPDDDSGSNGGGRGLFPMLAVTMRSPAGSLSVLDPEGRPVSRDRAAFMNEDAAGGAALRYRYGAEPGDYRIVVTAAKDTPYTLDVRSAGLDGELLSTSREGHLDAGEARTFRASISDPGDGELSATGEGPLDDLGPSTLAALVGGAAVGLGGAVTACRRRGGFER